MIRALPPFPPGAADGAAPPRARRCGSEAGSAAEPGTVRACAGTGLRSPGSRSAAASWPQPAELLGRCPALCSSGTCYPGDLGGEAGARELCAAASCTLGTGVGAGVP